MSAKDFIFLDEDYNYRESITFYQFVKASGTLECKEFFEFLKKQGIFNKKIKVIYIKPTIEKYWNKIKNNCDFRELPNSKNPVKIKNPSKKALQNRCDTELNIIAVFNELIANVITGIDMELFIYFYTTWSNDLAFVIDPKRFKDYNKFMSKYTKTIPYISMLTGFKQGTECMEVAFIACYFTMKNIDGKLYNFYNSSTVNKNKIKTFKKFPAYIELYGTKDKDCYNDFINI